MLFSVDMEVVEELSGLRFLVVSTRVCWICLRLFETLCNSGISTNGVRVQQYLVASPLSICTVISFVCSVSIRPLMLDVDQLTDDRIAADGPYAYR